jgi:metallo-beta-lactamase family protein
MKLSFLGAATTVTGSQFLLTTDRARVVIDCGMFQGSPAEAERSRVPLAYDPHDVDAVLVTHAHLDHCGLLPVLVREGFSGPLFLTRATAELVELVLFDSAKIQREQAERREQRARRHARQTARMEAEAAPADDEAPTPQADAARAGAHAGQHEAMAPPHATVPADVDQHAGDHEALLRAQPPVLRTEGIEPLYDEDDVAATVARFRTLDYDVPREVAPGVTATFRDAGHILGSAIIELEVEEGSGPSRRLVFSGDLGRPGTPILRDPTTVAGGADYVIMESTYGGREHEPAAEAVRLLAEVVRETASHRGVLLIPAFAIGRTQEIVWHLDRLLTAGQIPHLPLYLDSPMAALASDIYHRYPGYYDEETFALLQAGETPLDFPGAQATTSPEASRAIEQAPRPMIIVASSGMLTGGRVVFHLRELIDDPAALLLFVGYQGEGTLGAHLQAGARRIHLDGMEREVRCQVRSISGFSAHADESELLDWLRTLAASTRKPRTVFLVHGDPEALDALEPKVRAMGLSPYRPAFREEVELA